MPRIPSDLIRQLYDVPMFRGTNFTGEHGKWFTNNPEDASMWSGVLRENPPRYIQGANVVPVVGNTRGFLQLDVQGYPWNSIPGRYIKDPAVREQLKIDYKVADVDHATFNADQVAEAAEIVGLPGVEFQNIRDAGVATDPLPTHYYVADKRRRRSRFARFQDPNSDDLMAGLLLSLMGGTATGAAAALSQGQDNA